MTTIQKINLTQAELQQNQIDTLGYAVKNKYGRLKDLKEFDLTKGALVDEFINVGFLKTGYSRTDKTWGITKLGKGYFEDLQWGKLVKRVLGSK